LGNISSWIAHDLQSKGPEISHSITCSTALHAVLNGIAWIQSGLTNKFLVGGTEASLTEFTIAQMRALKIYASTPLSAGASTGLSAGASTSLSSVESFYPCRAFDLNKKKNTMVIGEGAAAICLEAEPSEKSLAKIIGIGYATEPLEHNISISTEADCFQRSMQMALGDLNPNEIDAVVMHAPGTIKGDVSEYKAIEKVFGNTLPFLTTNKWKLGHTFGASGMLSLELAILMLQHQKPIAVPFAEKQNIPKKIKNVLVNAVGFGGNAVSLLITQ
jgi:3-oxoacyl-(acyl-carrier-protein) synthase